MKDLKIDGRMTVKTLKEQFKENFGATLRVYYHKHFADEGATLASIRGEGAKGGDFSAGGTMKCGAFEEKIKEIFGIEVQVATPDDSELADNNATLTSVGECIDRNYWVSQSSEEQIAFVEMVIKSIGSQIKDHKFKPKYNKMFIGFLVDGESCGTVIFKPKKKQMNIGVHSKDENFTGLPADAKYDKGWHEFIITEYTEAVAASFLPALVSIMKK